MITPKRIAGRYSIDRVLGRGAMGVVYLGHDSQSGQSVAVKVLNPELLTAVPELVTRFVREGKALRQLNHPNIVGIVDMIEEDGRFYLVLEYVDGGTLKDQIQKNRTLSPKKAISLALDLADALTRAHRLGIIHRDLKPANVLLASDGTLRLTDFGMARLNETTTLTEVGAIIGTIAYLSPEACMGQPIDERSDIWSFGIILYEMLLGVRPFSGDNPAAIMHSILHSPLPDISRIYPGIDDRLIDLLYRIHVKEVAGRIPSIRLVGAELEKILLDDTQSTTGKFFREKSFATPVPSSQSLPHNLPAVTTPFVGRQQELAELTRLLNNPDLRLVTIIGAGGMGKTRLALELGRRLLEDENESNIFTQGIYFVALAPLTEPEAIVVAIAEATGYPIQDGDPLLDQVIHYLANKKLLLLVDNFEHLISGADIVSKILQAAPNIQIIVTSRQRLNISSESVFAIGGLGLPDGNTVGNAALDSALELFVYSARRTNLDFALNEENLPDVIQISRLVQGMPLGIILAAAWIDILSPAEIASEIETDLDFLITEMADMPARHRSMRAVFDYSWRLLDEGEQRNVACFSVFRGGFTREAAQSVADISLRQLVGLVNKSLLQRDTASGRFEMHELLRQMAKEKLEEQSQLVPTQQQHADYFRELANKISLRLHGENMTTWMRQIDTDYENFQTAYEWLLINDIIGALQIVRSLWLYWFIRGRFTEGRTWAMRALEKADAVNQSKAYAEGAYVLASFAYFQHDLPTASYWSGISLRLSELHNDLFGIGVSSHHHGLISLTKGNIEKAEAYFSEALEKIQLLPNRWLEQVLITDLGHVAYVRGDFEERRQLTLKGLSVSRQLGNEFLMVYDLANLADMMVEQGELDQAGKYVEECLTIASQIGEKRMIANSLLIQAKINQQQGHLETVTELICKSLSVSYDIRDRTGILEAMWFLIANLQLQEARMQAALLWGASETIYSQPDFLSLPQQSWESLFAGRAQNAELQQARERGQKMNLDEVVNFILGELCN